MARTTPKTTPRGKVGKVATGEVVMNNAARTRLASTVHFGSAVVSAASPKQVELRRNVTTGQAALARAAIKIVKAGVSLPVGGSVPLYRADPQDPSRLIRDLNGKTSTGVFVGGKFKVSIKR